MKDINKMLLMAAKHSAERLGNKEAVEIAIKALNELEFDKMQASIKITLDDLKLSTPYEADDEIKYKVINKKGDYVIQIKMKEDNKWSDFKVFKDIKDAFKSLLTYLEPTKQLRPIGENLNMSSKLKEGKYINSKDMDRILNIVIEIDPDIDDDIDSDDIYHEDAYLIKLDGDGRVWDEDLWDPSYKDVFEKVKKAIEDEADRVWGKKDLNESKEMEDFKFRLENIKEDEVITLTGGHDPYGFNTLKIEKNKKYPKYYHIWVEDDKGNKEDETKYSPLENVLYWARKYDDSLNESLNEDYPYSVVNDLIDQYSIYYHPVEKEKIKKEIINLIGNADIAKEVVDELDINYDRRVNESINDELEGLKGKRKDINESSDYLELVSNLKKYLMVDGLVVEKIYQHTINKTSNTLGGGTPFMTVGFSVPREEHSISSGFYVTFYDEDEAKKFYNSLPKNFSTIEEFESYLYDLYDSKDNTSAKYNIENVIRDLKEQKAKNESLDTTIRAHSIKETLSEKVYGKKELKEVTEEDIAKSKARLDALLKKPSIKKPTKKESEEKIKELLKQFLDELKESNGDPTDTEVELDSKFDTYNFWNELREATREKNIRLKIEEKHIEDDYTYYYLILKKYFKDEPLVESIHNKNGITIFNDVNYRWKDDTNSDFEYHDFTSGLSDYLKDKMYDEDLQYFKIVPNMIEGKVGSDIDLQIEYQMPEVLLGSNEYPFEDVYTGSVLDYVEDEDRKYFDSINKAMKEELKKVKELLPQIAKDWGFRKRK